jgi:hypothetical protein
MAAHRSIYFTELAMNSLKRRASDGTVETVVQDPCLHWVDAPAIIDGWIWLPVLQLDRTPPFNAGVSEVAWPVRLYRRLVHEIATEGR